MRGVEPVAAETATNTGFIIGAIIALVGLLILSAYFSLTETAFTSLNKLRIENLSKKSRTARLVLKISGHYERVLSTILIGNNIVNIAASVIATLLFVNCLGDIGPTIATVVVTIVVLIFGEVTPKSLAKEMGSSDIRVNAVERKTRPTSIL